MFPASVPTALPPSLPPSNVTMHLQAGGNIPQARGNALESLPPEVREVVLGISGVLVEHCPKPACWEKKQGPVPQLWELLRPLDEKRLSMSEAQRADVAVYLKNTVGSLYGENSESSDKALLLEVIDHLAGCDAMSLTGYMARRVFDGLGLPNLKMKEGNETEPSSRTFNSILPPLAGFASDYHAVGRTLLLEGALDLLSGPSQERRRSSLEGLLFDLSIHPDKNLIQYDQLADTLKIYEG
jgi:hypothetical protein